MGYHLLGQDCSTPTGGFVVVVVVVEVKNNIIVWK